MIALKEGLKLAIRYDACKGNLEAFKKALDKGNKLECYQIALGNYKWLLEMAIIEESDLHKLEKLAKGIGKVYYDNGKLMLRFNLKNGKLHGLYEEWYDTGQLYYRASF